MKEDHIEELITALYEMVQDARTMPLAADKCIVERDRVLDLLDEISAQLPGELKQARTIVESRNDLVNQARREAENAIRSAQAKASKMVSEDAVYVQTKRQCEELVRQTKAQMAELRTASFGYIAEALRKTESAVAQSLSEVRETQARFAAMTEAKMAGRPVPAESVQTEG